MNDYLLSMSPAPIAGPFLAPGTLDVKSVCQHCKRPAFRHSFRASDGFSVETYTCPIHQDIIPIRSHVANEEER